MRIALGLVSFAPAGVAEPYFDWHACERARTSASVCARQAVDRATPIASITSFIRNRLRSTASPRIVVSFHLLQAGRIGAEPQPLRIDASVAENPLPELEGEDQRDGHQCSNDGGCDNHA